MRGLIAAALGYPARMSITGSLSKTAAPSGGIVTSDAVTITVPNGSDGLLEEADRSDTGTVTLEFQRDGGGFTGGIPAGAASNGSTLEARITGASAGESSTFSIVETTSGRIVGGPYTITAS